MKNYDVLIVGSSPQSQQVAVDLAKTKRTVAMVSLPEEPETLQRRILQTLDQAGGANVLSPLSGPALTNMDLYSGLCRFVDEQTVQLGEERVTSKEFVLASGTAPHIPSLQGLDQIAYDTPLSLLNRSALPSSVTVLGAGPIGVALSAWLATKKCSVSLISRSASILPKEDAGLQNHFHRHLTDQGVQIWTQANPVQVRAASNKKIAVVVDQEGTRKEVESEALVLATGLSPHSNDLQLKNGGIYASDEGRVVINEQARASRKGVWAMGPVTGPEHALALETYQGEQIVHNMQAPFYDKKKMEPGEPFLFLVPGVVPYARVGLTEAEAVEKFKKVSCVEVGSYLKLVAKKNGDILGAHAAGPQAAAIGLFFEWAIRAQIQISDLLESRYFPPVQPAALIQEAVRLF